MNFRLDLNADIGERETNDAIDLRLLPLLNRVNIACGGHAGNQTWTTTLASLAQAAGLPIAAHLSYPDREHFGRRSMTISWSELAASLHDQLQWLPHIHSIKWHGALYNDAESNPDLARRLMHWCYDHGITTVLAPAGGEQARATDAFGLTVIREAFADRGYAINADQQMHLIPRSQVGAVWHNPELIAERLRHFAHHQSLIINGVDHAMTADTWCVHSDTPQAVAIAQRLRQEFPL